MEERQTGTGIGTGARSNMLGGKPHIGMDVIFCSKELADQHNGVSEHPAKITRVWDDKSEMVNLIVFFDAATPEPRISIHREGSSEQQGTRSWRPVNVTLLPNEFRTGSTPGK